MRNLCSMCLIPRILNLCARRAFLCIGIRAPRRVFLLGLILIAAIPAASVAMGVQSGQSEPERALEPGEYVPNEVLVGFREGVSTERAAAVAAELGLTVKRAFAAPGSYLLGFSDGRSVPAVIRSLQAHSDVKYAEPNRITRLNPIESPGAPAQPLQPGQPKQ